MTREEHEALWREHRKLAKEALDMFIESNHRDWGKWEEYKREYHLSNKHFGIMNGMYTKAYKKFLREEARLE